MTRTSGDSAGAAHGVRLVRVADDREGQRLDNFLLGQLKGAPRSLALMVALQALAEAGQGYDERALWHWQVAQQVAPEVAGIDMAPFGAAGAALLGKAPRQNCGTAALPTTASVVKPRALDRPRPVYPDGLRAAGVRGTVIVEAVVGVDGVPREPRVLTPQAPPSLILAAAESLLLSRFTPARLGPEAVPFCFASSVRSTDFVARYGGEEFVFILPGSTLDDAQKLMNRIREKVAEVGFHFRGTPVSVTISCGLTALRSEDGADDAFDRADKALYQAKDAGRNRVTAV